MFKEGDLVKEGAALYRIEKDQFEAAVEQAQGAVERSKAALALGEAPIAAGAGTAGSKSGTVVARDQAQAQRTPPTGSHARMKPTSRPRRSISATPTFVAPIAGKIGRTNVTKGNVVGPDRGVLTTIVSQDPMYVTFPVSQREFLRVRQAGRPLDPEDLKK